jgi:hypothetical protein
VESFPDLDVRNWPLVDCGWLGVLVVVLTLALGVMAWRMTESPAMGLTACSAIALSMWQFWLPVRYRLRGRGIIRDCLGHRRLIPWRAIEDCRLLTRGVAIRLRRQDVLLDLFTEHYIGGREQRDELLAAIESYRQADMLGAPGSSQTR